MKYITFVFSKPVNVKIPIFSWLIKKYENTDYSHVSMHFFSKSLDRVLVYEAVGVGVRFVGKTIWDQHAQPVHQFKVDINDDQYIKIMQHCVDTAGMEYGLKIALGMYLAKVFKLKKNPYADPNKKVCSKAIGELLIELGYKIDKDLDLLDPQDVFYILSRGTNG